MADRLLTTAEVTAVTGYSKTTIYRCMDEGLLTRVQPRGEGTALRFRESEVNAIIAGRTAAAAKQARDDAGTPSWQRTA